MIRKLSKKLLFNKKILNENTPEEKIFLMSNSILKSYWHDVDLINKSNSKYNMIVEIPYKERIIREMNKDENKNPIKVKINKSTGNQVNLRDYNQDPVINYGFFPMTFSSNSKLYFNQFKGDNDPLDVIDIGGPFNKLPGDICDVNILGSFCLVDQGETDLKVIVSGNSNTDKLTTKDVEKINYTMEWFKNFKTFYGKPANKILDNKLFSKEETEKMIKEFHQDYLESKYCIDYHNMFLKDTTVNFHFTRKCNYECKFCFHTKKTSYILPLEKQIEILKQFKEAGVEKMNFAGGEPFLYPEILGELVKACKELKYDSVSIISNGKLITENWIKKYGDYLDILGISCDSTNPNINFVHGRKVAGSDKTVDEKEKIINISKWCQERNIIFKINTVVTALNKHEDMSEFINLLQPSRWKVFQVLPIDGENYSKDNSIKNNIQDLLITETDFNEYLKRNSAGLKNKSILVPESNEMMLTSYLLVDEFGCFLDCSIGGKTKTNSILDVGLKNAYLELQNSFGKGFNEELLHKRGGYYPETWNKNKRINYEI